MENDLEVVKPAYLANEPTSLHATNPQHKSSGQPSALPVHGQWDGSFASGLGGNLLDVLLDVIGLRLAIGPKVRPIMHGMKREYTAPVPSVHELPGVSDARVMYLSGLSWVSEVLPP